MKHLYYVLRGLYKLLIIPCKGIEPIDPTEDQIWYIDEHMNLQLNVNSKHFKDSFKKNIETLRSINDKE